MKGFSLLEVIVALIIAGLAALALFRAAGIGLHQTQTAAMYDQAIVRAKSHLASATHGTALVPGDSSGDDGGGFRWRVRVVPLSRASLRPDGLLRRRAAASIPVVLYAVSVWVGWNDGDSRREIRLDTETVGG